MLRRNDSLRLIGLACLALGLTMSGCGEDDAKKTSSSSSSGEGGDDEATDVAPPQKALAPQEQVKVAFDGWCRSQVRGGFEKYRAFYADDFEGIRRTAARKPKTFDRAGWLKDRKDGYDSPLKVDCLNPKISLSSDNKRAEVVFEQYFRTPTYSDQGDKKIELGIRGGRWLLVSEEALTAKKWNRKKFRDGSLATAGPPKAKVGRLKLRNLRALIEGRDRPMSGSPGTGMDFIQGYCNGKAPQKLRAFQVKPRLPKDVKAAAYRYKIRGSTTTYEDDEGYYACNEKRLKQLGKGEVPAAGDVIELALDDSMKVWPCSYKIQVTAVDEEGTPLAKGRTKGGISCPE